MSSSSLSQILSRLLGFTWDEHREFMVRVAGGKDPRMGGQRSGTEYILTAKSPGLSETCFLHLGNGETRAHSSSGKHIDLCWSMVENPS